MARAEWNGVVIADSDVYETVEGNIYFPRASVAARYLRDSATHTVCGWKGTASYYHVIVDGLELDDAAWFYPDPQAAAARIKDHIAFWRGIRVTT